MSWFRVWKLHIGEEPTWGGIVCNCMQDNVQFSNLFWPKYIGFHLFTYFLFHFCVCLWPLYLLHVEYWLTKPQTPIFQHHVLLVCFTLMLTHYSRGIHIHTKCTTLGCSYIRLTSTFQHTHYSSYACGFSSGSCEVGRFYYIYFECIGSDLLHSVVSPNPIM